MPDGRCDITKFDKDETQFCFYYESPVMEIMKGVTVGELDFKSEYEEMGRIINALSGKIKHEMHFYFNCAEVIINGEE